MAQVTRWGHFDCEEITPGRWRLTNALTSIVHFTYGTPTEVERRAVLQSAAWDSKLGPGARGSAWRTKPKRP